MSLLASAAVLLPLLAGVAQAQVTATGTNGVTNPPAPTLGVYNQTSYSRLLSVNSYDDFCIFSPPVAGDTIGDTEEEQVAWCTKPRNDARVIPDGTISAVHFRKTDMYVQISGYGDLTKLNIQAGDEGGELDPHGSTGLGNPVGGNVTSNVTGSDVFYQEWMNYVSYNQFCIRVCTAANETYTAAEMCEHTFDLMGCDWVMPNSLETDVFDSCDADAAYPPGVYPIGSAGSGTTSTFAQRYTGVWSDATETGTFTIGVTVTPQTAFSTPASSNCATYSSIANGLTDLVAATATAGSSSGSGSGSGSASSASATASAAVSSATGSAAKGASSASKAASGAAASVSAAVSSATSAATSAGYRSSSQGVPYLGALLTLGAGVLGAGALFL